MKLVFGLGNPGRSYARTRHNVGYLVIDRLCARRGVEADKRQFEAVLALVGQGEDKVGLIKPETYMNLSGRAIRALAGYYRAEPEDLLVVCDDLALPPGRLRLRGSGSSGGQKGLESAIASLGTQAFARLRLGIGQAPPVMDAADYVLGRFGEDEVPLIAAAVERAADCVECWLARGLDEAMRIFNVDPEAEEKRKREAEERKAERARRAADAEASGGAEGGGGDRRPTKGDATPAPGA
jgi:PTH1 family peptidyl-tRNA hydrolase